MKIMAICLMVLMILTTVIGAEQCSDCTNGCIMQTYDGCNTCVQTVYCKDDSGEEVWTTTGTQYCTASYCTKQIENPLR